MAAARLPPSSEPAKVQLRRPTATARSLRSAALFVMHQPSIIEEASERIPTLETVVDGLAGLAVLGDLRTLLAQPSPQRDDEWTAARTALSRALLRRQAVDLALDRKQRIDACDCF